MTFKGQRDLLMLQILGKYFSVSLHTFRTLNLQEGAGPVFPETGGFHKGWKPLAPGFYKVWMEVQNNRSNMLRNRKQSPQRNDLVNGRLGKNLLIAPSLHK